MQRRKKLLKTLRNRLAMLEQVLEAYLESLEKAYPKSSIILFGSRARGDFLPYSNYDIVLVLEKPVDRIEETVRARRLKPAILPADILVVSLEELLKDPILEKMLENGCILLYDALGVRDKIKDKCINASPKARSVVRRGG